MRGIAAIVVMMTHMGGEPARLLSGGYLAVDFFFVLSGFVLAHAYGERTIGTAAFMRARAIRLYPLYLIGLVVGVAAAFATGTAPAQITVALVLGLFFLPAPTLDLYPLDPPSWSLFFELFANASWFPVRRVLTGALAAVAILLGALAILSSDIAFGAVDGGGYWSNIAGGFARVGFSFMAGVLIYRLRQRIGARLPLPGAFAIVGLLVVLAAPLPRRLFDPIAVLILMPSLVFLGASCNGGGRLFSRVQAQLGAASYAIYILHFPVIVVVDRLLIPRLAISHPSLVTTPLTSAVVIGAALFLDRYYDRPTRRWLTASVA